jgi:hypothetical protein
LKFLLDENLPPALARALNALSAANKHSVEHVRDFVPLQTSDVEWISKITSEGGWSVLSGDRRMLTRQHELKALTENKVTTFIFASGWSALTFWEKAWLLVRWWPTVVALACTSTPGSIFIIPYKQKPEKLKQHR